MPLYAVYGVLLSNGAGGTCVLSALLAVWSLTGLVAEVPAGLLADRLREAVGRRPVLAASVALQALGYSCWLVAPGVPAYAAGFVLWGLGGALGSGVLEALLWGGLAAAGRSDAYAAALGRVTAARLVAQAPAAGAASLLLALGGVGAVGWASVALLAGVALLALRLPEASAPPPSHDAGEEPRLRDAVRAVCRTGVRGPVLAVAALAGIDAVEEYDGPLLAGWGVPLAVLPIALLALPLAAAGAAALAGHLPRWARPGRLAVAAAAGFVAASAMGGTPAIGVLAAAYAVYRLVLVTAEARLQAAAPDCLRVTAASVASSGSELVAFAVYGAWALGGLAAVGLLLLAVGGLLPVLLRTPLAQPRPRPIR